MELEGYDGPPGARQNPQSLNVHRACGRLHRLWGKGSDLEPDVLVVLWQREGLDHHRLVVGKVQGERARRPLHQVPPRNPVVVEVLAGYRGGAVLKGDRHPRRALGPLRIVEGPGLKGVRASDLWNEDRGQPDAARVLLWGAHPVASQNRGILRSSLRDVRLQLVEVLHRGVHGPLLDQRAAPPEAHALAIAQVRLVQCGFEELRLGSLTLGRGGDADDLIVGQGCPSSAHVAQKVPPGGPDRDLRGIGTKTLPRDCHGLTSVGAAHVSAHRRDLWVDREHEGHGAVGLGVQVARKERLRPPVRPLELDGDVVQPRDLGRFHDELYPVRDGPVGAVHPFCVLIPRVGVLGLRLLVLEHDPVGRHHGVLLVILLVLISSIEPRVVHRYGDVLPGLHRQGAHRQKPWSIVPVVREFKRGARFDLQSILEHRYVGLHRCKARGSRADHLAKTRIVLAQLTLVLSDICLC